MRSLENGCVFVDVRVFHIWLTTLFMLRIRARATYRHDQNVGNEIEALDKIQENWPRPMYEGL